MIANGPQRIDVTTIETVTPELTDRILVIKNGELKTSLFQNIYNLFKAGYDALYITAAQLVVVLNDYATKAYADNAAGNAELNANEYTDVTATTLLKKFNINNNNDDVGNVYSANLNGETGTVFFSGVLAPNASATYTVGNSSCTPFSRITDLGLIGVGDVNIAGHTPIGNAFFVTVKNNTGANVSGFRLTFRINN